MSNQMFSFLSFHSKIVELEEELRVVGNNLKSLEVSEEKVNSCVIQIVTKTRFMKKNFANFHPRINFMKNFFVLLFYQSTPDFVFVSTINF